MPLTSGGSTHWWANPTVSHSRWRTAGQGLESEVLFNPPDCHSHQQRVSRRISLGRWQGFAMNMWEGERLQFKKSERARERALGSISGCGSVFVHPYISSHSCLHVCVCVCVCDPYDAFDSFFWLWETKRSFLKKLKICTWHQKGIFDLFRWKVALCIVQENTEMCFSIPQNNPLVFAKWHYSQLIENGESHTVMLFHTTSVYTPWGIEVMRYWDWNKNALLCEYCWQRQVCRQI